MKNKKGGILEVTIIHIVLIGIIFALFLFAMQAKINSRGVRQQVLEKQMALLIDSATPGMNFEIRKKGFEGTIHGVEVRDNNIFISVAGLESFNGYPYFSLYSVKVEEESDKFVVSVYG